MGRNKMNNKKTLTSLAAASMVITQAGQMSVFAKGATADPETPAEKEETKVEKTQKNYQKKKLKKHKKNQMRQKKKQMQKKQKLKPQNKKQKKQNKLILLKTQQYRQATIL